jgi:hypothetical protein
MRRVRLVSWWCMRSAGADRRCNTARDGRQDLAMLSALTALLDFVWSVSNAVDQYRRQRALGLKMQWDKALATAGGCILVTGVGLGSLFAGLALDAPILGTSGCVVLIIGGMIGLIILVNRRWPRRPGE